MAYKFPKYPENWKELREDIFEKYGGKYCTEWGIHKGSVHVHHHVYLSWAKDKIEYKFLNQCWNLEPLCEKHHKKRHPHMTREIKGKYKPRRTGKKKSNVVRRLAWRVKRRHYYKKFEKRKDSHEDYRILSRYKYWRLK